MKVVYDKSYSSNNQVVLQLCKVLGDQAPINKVIESDAMNVLKVYKNVLKVYKKI
jgi:hypothetical protein